MSEPSLLLQSKYVPASYSLRLGIDNAKPNYSGLLRVDVSQNALYNGDVKGFSMYLHAHRLIITKAELNLQSGDAIKLLVKTDREKQTIELSAETEEPAVSVTITYLGSIATIRTYHDETYGVFKTNYSDSVSGKSDNYIIATHAQPYGSRRIFPVLDELVLKVPISLTIQTKSLFKVVSNAALKSSQIIDMTEDSLYEFEPTPPILPAHFGFALGDFEVLEDSSARVPIRVLTTKGDSSHARYALDVSVALFPVFEDLLGQYPLTKFDIVALPFLADVVMENWGMVTVIRDKILIDPYNASSDAKYTIRQLIAHQLTHQWFANSVSLDDWRCLWFIESFATFVGNYALSVKGIEASDTTMFEEQKLFAIQDFMDIDCFIDLPLPSPQEYMNGLDVSAAIKTNNIFEQQVYDKGLILLNMIATLFQLENKSPDYTHFFKAFREVTKEYEYKIIKIFDIWNILNRHTSYELLSFAHSWFRHVGYPIVEVKVKNNAITVCQNRFLYNNDAQSLNLENSPFHVPLATKVRTDKGDIQIANLMLSDRSMDLEIPPSQLICLNSGNQFYYKTVYSQEILDVLLKNVAENILSSSDLLAIIRDYGKILGQHTFHSDADLYGSSQLNFFIKLAKVLSSESWRIDFEVLKACLSYLEIINSIFLHFTEYTRFQIWLDGVYFDLYNKIGGWNAVLDLKTDDYDPTEYEVRNMILQGASSHKEVQSICKKLYKNMVSSGVSQRFTAKELFPLIFNVTAANANMNEYKQIMALAKNSDVSLLKHSNGLVQDLQTAAVSSLAFCKKPDLLSKTLHFVNNNIDSKLIELCLLGYKFHHSTQAKEQLWAWYTVNYDLWVKRSLRKGSDWSKQIGIATGNISNLVLGEVMQYRIDDVKAFVDAKEKSLPPHKLQERFERLEAENEEKRAIADLYKDLCI